MSGISTGIGLISGIDTASLIDQLIAIERRPVETLQERVTAIDVQRAAFLELSAQLLAVQNTMTGFGKPSFFRQFIVVTKRDNLYKRGEKSIRKKKRKKHPTRTGFEPATSPLCTERRPN